MGSGVEEAAESESDADERHRAPEILEQRHPSPQASAGGAGAASPGHRPSGSGRVGAPVPTLLLRCSSRFRTGMVASLGARPGEGPDPPTAPPGTTPVRSPPIAAQSPRDRIQIHDKSQPHPRTIATTPNTRRPKIANFGPQVRATRPQDANLWTRDAVLWTRDGILWTRGAVLWTPDEHLWTRGAVLWTRGANPWTRGANLWTRGADSWSRGGLRGALGKARAGPSSRPDMIRMRSQSDPPQPPPNTSIPPTLSLKPDEAPFQAGLKLSRRSSLSVGPARAPEVPMLEVFERTGSSCVTACRSEHPIF